MFDSGIRLAVTGHDHLDEAGPEADDVAWLYQHMVILKDAHKDVVAHLIPAYSEVAEEIEEHLMSLHIAGEHLIEAESVEKILESCRFTSPEKPLLLF